MLRPNELAAMRGCLNTAFPDRCDILTNTGALSPLGQTMDKWTVADPKTDANIGCRIIPQTGTSEREVGSETTATAEALMTLPSNTKIDASQRVRVKSNGQTYEVIYVHNVGAEDLSRLVDVKIVG